MEVLSKNLSVYSALMKQDSDKVHEEFPAIEKDINKMIQSYFEQKLGLKV